MYKIACARATVLFVNINTLLYAYVSKGLEANKFKNLIG